MTVRPVYSKLATAFLALVALALASPAWAAPQLSLQKRIGLTTGDQWEPAVAADASGHIYALYPQYGPVPNCAGCSVPTMLLVVSADNGKTWQAPRVMLAAGSGQFDAQIVVDPADRRTIFAAWLENKKREVILAKSSDSGASWSFATAARSEEELDKPALAVRGQSVYVAFNHEEEVWVAASQDGGRSFVPSRVNADSRPGWSLFGSATIDPAGNAYLAWASYSKAGGARGSVNFFVGKSADAGKTWSAKSARHVRRGSRMQRRRVRRGLPGRADRAYLRHRWHALRSLERRPYAVRCGAHLFLVFDRRLRKLVAAGRRFICARRRGACVPGNCRRQNGDIRIAWMDTRNAPYWNTYYRSSSTAAQPGRRKPASPATFPVILYQKSRFPFPVRRLFQHGHRQSRRHPDRLGRRPQLPVARIDLALQRPLDLALNRNCKGSA